MCSHRSMRCSKGASPYLRRRACPVWSLALPGLASGHARARLAVPPASFTSTFHLASPHPRVLPSCLFGYHWAFERPIGCMMFVGLLYDPSPLAYDTARHTPRHATLTPLKRCSTPSSVRMHVCTTMPRSSPSFSRPRFPAPAPASASALRHPRLPHSPPFPVFQIVSA